MRKNAQNFYRKFKRACRNGLAVPSTESALDQFLQKLVHVSDLDEKKSQGPLCLNQVQICHLKKVVILGHFVNDVQNKQTCPWALSN